MASCPIASSQLSCYLRGPEQVEKESVEMVRARRTEPTMKHLLPAWQKACPEWPWHRGEPAVGSRRTICAAKERTCAV